MQLLCHFNHYNRLTGAGGVDIWVEERGDERHLGWSRGEVVLEDDLALVQPALPGGALLTGDPIPEIHI